eukprot:gene9789-9947_t
MLRYRAELVQAVVTSPAPAGAAAVRVDVYPKAVELELGQEVLDAGYTLPMHPSDYSHMLFMVQLAPTCWRWSYMHKIDPADLHPEVTAHPAVAHVKARVQDASVEIEQLLAGQQADLLVCDMNNHPVLAWKLISPAIQHLRKGGWLILTLKFYGRGRDKHTMAEQLDKCFEGQFETGVGLWLLANTTCERTYAARKA